MKASFSRSALALFWGIACCLVSRPAASCDSPAPTLHEVTTHADSEPPEQVVDVTTSVERGIGPESDGCSSQVTSCDDIGKLTLRFPIPDDDQTASDKLGYLITLESGNSPLVLQEQAIVPFTGATEVTIWLYWDDGATDQQEPLDFTLKVKAVDSDGNVGPESEPIVIQNTVEDSGCSLRRVSARSLWTGALLSFAALFWLRRRSAR